MTVVVGVLLNPIAGFGGALAMHGTDSLPADRFDEAVRAGRAESRLLQALARFGDAGVAAEFVAAPGLLGSSALAAAGIPHRTVGQLRARTDRQDTIDAVRLLAAEGVEVVLFAGGDGTATDIVESVGVTVPVIGVPSGVKMHSEVFSRSASNAGRLLADFVAGHTATELAEVLDVGGDDVSRVVGLLLAPRSREALQGAKMSVRSISSAAAGLAVARDLVAEAGSDTTWLIGPGTTAGAIAEALGFGGTLRGVDVRFPSGTMELDVAEERLHEIVTAVDNPRLVLGVVGGQGFLLGRGNQQISARVIAGVGTDRIEVVATSEKIGSLVPPVLYLDIDEPQPLLGYRRVRTGARQSTVMKVVDAAA